MRALTMRIVTVLAIALTFVLLFSLSPRGWRVFSQGQQQQLNGYVSYQFHTLKHPTGLAYSNLLYGLYPFCGSSSHLFIVDTGNHLIRVFNFAQGSLCTLAGNGTAGYVNGYVSNAEFNHPTGIDVISASRVVGGITHSWNIIYISDASNYVLRYFCTGNPYQDSRCPTVNTVSTWAGTGTKGYVNGSPTTAEFAHMAGMHASLGFTVDMENHAIRTVGSSVGTFAGTGNPGFVNGYRTSAQFNAPSKLANDSSGNTYVTDTGNFVIRKIDTSGNVTTFAGTGQPGYVDGAASQAQFQFPTGVAYNTSDGYLYVADTQNNVIRRIDGAGNVSTYAGTGVAGLTNGSLSQAQFFAPTDLIIVNGSMYVADSNNNAIRRIDMTNLVVYTYIS